MKKIIISKPSRLTAAFLSYPVCTGPSQNIWEGAQLQRVYLYQISNVGFALPCQNRPTSEILVGVATLPVLPTSPTWLHHIRTGKEQFTTLG